VAVAGLPPEPRLNRVVDVSTGPVRLPDQGLVLSTMLAEILDAQLGDTLVLEVLEGRRPVENVRVTMLVEEYMGLSAFMNIDALRRVMGEGDSISGAVLSVDEARIESLFERLKETPRVAGVSLKSAAIQAFNATLAETFYVMIFFNLLFSSVIAFGVVYNAARVALAERSRELASLRVLGFRRTEISAILLGELAVVTLVAIPVGLLLGYVFAGALVAAFSTELYRFPLVVSPRTFAYATSAVLVAATLSGLLVRRGLDRLDLIAVLKVKE
jgi:putative ABC transport system permease protein